MRNPTDCVNFAEVIGSRILPEGGIEPVHRCKDASINETTLPQCQGCAKFCTKAPRAPRIQQPKFMVVNQREEPLAMDDTWLNGHVFFTLSGPSLRLIQREELAQPGIVTFGVNNSATVVRPSFWVYGDKGDKFHNVIWEDPGIIKFMPTRGWNPKHPHMVREKRPDGSFVTTNKQGRFCPGSVGYIRNSLFKPETFLYEETCNWGNSKKSAAENGHPHILNIMFVIFRLSFYLGFRNVYLLGCDFNMRADNPYAFQERKDTGACDSNNGTYLKLNHMLSLLKPHFDNAGYNVFNCTPNSGLRTFPFLSFQEAVANAKASIPSVVDTTGWYD